MPPPTPLSVQTSAITRLLKEQESYKTELASQERRLKETGDGEEDEEGNREWKVGQEVCGVFCFVLFFVVLGKGKVGGGVGRRRGGGGGNWVLTKTYGEQKRAISETKAIFAPLRERISAAVERVEGMLVRFSPLSCCPPPFPLRFPTCVELLDVDVKVRCGDVRYAMLTGFMW